VPDVRSIDIDTAADFEAAEEAVRRGLFVLPWL
jgi:hypothetical protein